MRKILLLITLIIASFVVHAQVGINDDSGTDDFTTTPISEGSALEVRSNSRAILIPRLTTNAINAITGEPGMVVYDKDLNCYKGYDNDHWQILGEDCDPPAPNTPPVASAVGITGNVNVGETVTGTYTYSDTNGDAESGSTYQWYIDTDNTGNTRTLIPSATAITYEIANTYEGNYLSFCVVPNDGTDTGSEVCSSYSLIGAELPPPARINEIDYDNPGSDNNEFVEVRVDLGTDVSNMTLVSYNGSNRTQMDTESVIGGTKTSDANYDYYVVLFPVLQNGAPDGVALLNGTNVIEFLSYEGTFTAANGPAAGETSTDIGVSDNNVDNISAQLSDDGASWYMAQPTPNAANMVTPTTIKFSTATATVLEGSGATTLTIEIANPSPGTATTADVVLTNGSAADLGNYTTQAISFAAGSSASQTISVTVLEDADTFTENYVFQLQNVNGGNNASAISPSSFTLTVTDNDSPPQAATYTQDFEGGTGTYVYGYTAGGALTTDDGPYPNTPNHVSGNTGMSFSGNQTHLNFDPINTSAGSSASVTFRVAAFADDGNIQFDGSEWIIVGLRTSNGGSAENVLIIEGGRPAYDFSSTATYTTSYNGSGNLDYAHTSNAPYSYITIDNLPITNYLKLIMVSRTDDATKKWVIDDVVLTINP